MCARIAFSAAAGWRRRTARWMSRCWRRISAPSTRGEIFAISCGCSTSRIQPVKDSSSSLPAASARIWWKRLSASLNGGVPGSWLGGLVDRRLQGRGGRLGGVGRGEPGERHLEEHARVDQLRQRHALGREHHRDRLADVAAHALVRRAGDEDAAPRGRGRRGSGGCCRQQPQALAQRGAADAQLARELLLSADPIAGLEAFALQVAADLERDLMARVDTRGSEAQARATRTRTACGSPSYASAYIKSFRARRDAAADEAERDLQQLGQRLVAARRARVGLHQHDRGGLTGDPGQQRVAGLPSSSAKASVSMSASERTCRRSSAHSSWSVAMACWRRRAKSAPSLHPRAPRSPWPRRPA